MLLLMSCRTLDKILNSSCLSFFLWKVDVMTIPVSRKRTWVTGLREVR